MAGQHGTHGFKSTPTLTRGGIPHHEHKRVLGELCSQLFVDIARHKRHDITSTTRSSGMHAPRQGVAELADLRQLARRKCETAFPDRASLLVPERRLAFKAGLPRGEGHLGNRSTPDSDGDDQRYLDLEDRQQVQSLHDERENSGDKKKPDYTPQHAPHLRCLGPPFLLRWVRRSVPPFRFLELTNRK